MQIGLFNHQKIRKYQFKKKIPNFNKSLKIISKIQKLYKIIKSPHIQVYQKHSLPTFLKTF